MKTNLFYFSATGNSLMVAKTIAAQLPDTQIYSIPDVIEDIIDTDADNIGLIFPVFYTGMPRMMINFINHLNIDNTKYLFAICTYGGFPGGTLLQTERQLQSKGLTLHAGFTIQLPGNYIVEYGAFSYKRQAKVFAKAKTKFETIVKAITDRQDNKIETNNFLINGIGELVYKVMLPKFPTLDRNFNAGQNCISCNLCEKICPAKNITMVDGKPTWQGNCEHCLACIQWCPQEAIQYKQQTVNRKRYHHPEITAKELYRRPKTD